MSFEFKCSKGTVDTVLQKMKKNKIISPDAEFHYSSPNDLRKEVRYRDLDFLQRLGRINEVETTDSILELLINKGFVDKSSNYNRDAFEIYRIMIKDNFEVPWTSVTPVMERLLYLLSSARKPEMIFAAGIYCGNTFAWNVGPGFGKNKTYTFKKAIGIEIDQGAIEIAQTNYSKLKNVEQVELICADALKIADEIDEEIDYLYLDADCEKIGKRIYLEILKALYPKLTKSGWVLAHDITEWCFLDDLREYKDFVRDKSNFSESICFDIDSYGLELSIK